jgi:ribosomal protein S18 acetylase RimI-like enzyme
MEYKQIGSASYGQDIAQYVNAYIRLFNDTENLKFLSFTGIPFLRETIEAWLADADQAGVQYIAAIADNEIRAILCIRSNRIEGFEIMALVVDVQFRCRGIGSQLLETAAIKAKEYGFKAITMAVFTDNRPMLALAINNGFKPAKIEYHARYDGEDILFLRKPL